MMTSVTPPSPSSGSVLKSFLYDLGKEQWRHARSRA